MRKSTIILTGVLLAGLLAAGCSPDDPTPVEIIYPQPTGEGIFANYVAVGNSLTAGYMDSGLMMAGQTTSFPQLIATQFGYPAGSFAQPLIASPGVGTSTPSDPANAAGVLYFDAATGGIAVLDETPLTQVPALAVASTWPVPYSNLGIPGATLKDFTDALDSSTSQSPGNSFFDLILRNPTFGNVNMRDQLIARGPTIATMWLGNNDVLGGATSGQPNDGVVHPGQGVNLTPSALFEPMYTGMLDAVLDGVETRHGHRPLIFTANIPSITSVPFFVPKELFRTAAGLPDAATLPVFTIEADAEIVLFTALGYLLGGGALPLPAQYSLSVAEADLVAATVDAYNDVISDAVAARPEVFLYDANADLAALDPMTEGAHFLVLAGAVGPETAAQTTLFSLDGVHPNSRGYGVVANGFLDAINTALGTAFPAVDVDALTWDPTYGNGYGGAKSSGYPTLSPAAAEGIPALFR